MLKSRTLVTGASGYIGSHLARTLCECGEEVHVIVRSETSRQRIPAQIRAHYYDGSAGSAARIVEEVAPAALFHLAACAVREHQPADIDRLVQANITFGTHLADAVLRQVPDCTFVFTASYSQYPCTSSYQPQSLYSATKQAFMDILKFFSDAGLRTITTVLMDTYGVGDTRGRIVDLLVEATLSGQPLRASPGEQLLDLTHVNDVVRALLAAERLVRSSTSERGKVYWVSSEQQVTIRQLAERIQELAGRKADVRWGARSYRVREAMRPWVGPRLPGWIPRVGLDDGLRALLQLQGGTPTVAK